MIKTVLDYWSPKNETVVTETGFRYLNTDSVIKSTKEISDETYIGLFEQFYKLNNKLRYCNGSYYTFQNKLMEFYYKEWLKSDDYNKKSFDLYYGNGVVD
jgi:hypothetical protein